MIQWFAQNPQVTTVFVSDHPGAVERAPGQSEKAALVAGIEAAWAKLPATVKHIVVIRDVPFIEQGTLQCVSNAIARHLDAGTSCAFPRSRGLHQDPDVLAAEQLHSPRVQVIDLTQFFCGSRLCYPVIGGVLVYKDYFDHLTDEYATTLGALPPARGAGLDEELALEPLLFPTIQFAIFFPLVLAGSWALMPHPRLWKPFITAASYVFYGTAGWTFCFLLGGVTLWNQLAAVVLHRTADERRRR